jgi:hypothetical protein
MPAENGEAALAERRHAQVEHLVEQHPKRPDVHFLRREGQKLSEVHYALLHLWGEVVDLVAGLVEFALYLFGDEHRLPQHQLKLREVQVARLHPRVAFDLASHAHHPVHEPLQSVRPLIQNAGLVKLFQSLEEPGHRAPVAVL